MYHSVVNQPRIPRNCLPPQRHRIVPMVMASAPPEQSLTILGRNFVCWEQIHTLLSHNHVFFANIAGQKTPGSWLPNDCFSTPQSGSIYLCADIFVRWHHQLSEHPLETSWWHPRTGLPPVDVSPVIAKSSHVVSPVTSCNISMRFGAYTWPPAAWC